MLGVVGRLPRFGCGGLAGDAADAIGVVAGGLGTAAVGRRTIAVSVEVGVDVGVGFAVA
ncbi:hypothetical protein ACSNOK_33310 [Streptomyces sp. URMC 126]|uniref:hypothetical protein n=1 Tax=Streptomyces sp. URMC 126 TaxID=3423401 RepID=UPI003F1A3A01